MISWTIQQIADTTSTNDEVKLAAASGAGEGLVIWALQQSAGRGRRERSWASPAGNLYCSILLKHTTSLAEIGFYSFVAALSVRDALKEYLPSGSIVLKWPNDVLVNSKKISGILLETVEQGIVLGLGINVLYHPRMTLTPATSLRAEGCPDINLELLLKAVLRHLQTWLNVLQNDGFSPIRMAWLENALRGNLKVELAHETLYGTFGDLDKEGRLRLDLADGTERAIASGDVFMAPKDDE